VATVQNTVTHNTKLDVPASVTLGTQTEWLTTNNADTDSLTVLKKPDVTITETVDKTTLNAGQAAVWSFTVTNTSGANVGPVDTGSAIKVQAPIPTGLTTTTAPKGTNWDCSASTAALLDCTYTGTYPVTAGSAVGGVITLGTTPVNTTPTNTVFKIDSQVSITTQTELSTTNNSATASTTYVLQPDLVLTKSVSSPKVYAGDPVSWTLKITNQTGTTVGPVTTGSPIRIQETLPTYLSMTTKPSGTNWDCSASTTTKVDCTYTGTYPINPGSAVGGDITYTTPTSSTTPNGTTVNSSSTVTLNGTQTEITTTNNTQVLPVLIEIRQIDLSLTKQADKSVVRFGDTVVFTLTLTNNSPNAALGVNITDVLPAHLQWVSDDSNGKFNATTGIWNAGDIPANGVSTLKITSKVIE
jgi:uncharacterized repeat protein (TIGR01451 family)